MNADDKTEFVKTMTTAALNYGREVTSELAALYFGMFKDYTVDEFKLAMRRHLEDSDQGRFWPTVAHLMDKLPRKTETSLSAHDRAVLSWSVVMDQLAKVGPTKTPDFDQTTRRCVGALGGWRSLCELSFDELKWKQKTFIEFFLSVDGTPQNLSIGYDRPQQQAIACQK